MARQHILYAFHGRFPDPRAAALFAAEEAISFAELCDVTFVVPTRDTTDLAKARTQFSFPESIELVALPTTDLYRFPIIRRFSFEVSLFTFARAVSSFLKEKGTSIDWVVTADHSVAAAAKKSGKKVLFEIHDFPKRNALWKSALESADIILATNEWKQTELVKQFGVAPERIILERNGVDIDAFSNPISKSEARKKLDLPIEGKIAVYTGHLYAWKGVNTLAEAAKLIPDVTIYFVGGTEYDSKRFSKLYGQIANVRLVGQRPHGEIPLWQAASDVLVLPNTGRQSISEHYTSPMKLFEYMASSRPIVASALPSIMEVVDESMAYLCEPDDAAVLAHTIESAISDPAATQRAAKAREHAEEFSWDKRAARLMAHMSHRAPAA